MIKLTKSTFYKEKLTKEKLCVFIGKSKQLSIGEQCSNFEKNFSIWQRRKYSVMFNSGSSANLALIQALLSLKRVKKGDMVGFSAVTWATNVMPLITMGLDPIPVDVELDTLNISPKKLAQAYNKYKFKILFITNLLGYCDDIGEIRDYCQKNKIILLEDNCESLGSEYKKTKLGNFGHSSTFSFYVGHHLSTIEGGMVCTDDKEMDTMLRMVRAHGWDRNLSSIAQKKLRKKYEINNFYSKYTFYNIGYNLRPTEISGFLGVNQLKYLDEIIDRREKNYMQLKKIYSNLDFMPITTKNLTKISNFAFPIICRTSKKRGEYIKLAKESGIEIRPVVAGNIIKQPFFLEHTKKRFLLPNAQKIHDAGFYFGNNPEMTKTEIELLIKTFL